MSTPHGPDPTRWPAASTPLWGGRGPPGSGTPHSEACRTSPPHPACPTNQPVARRPLPPCCPRHGQATRLHPGPGTAWTHLAATSAGAQAGSGLSPEGSGAGVTQGPPQRKPPPARGPLPVCPAQMPGDRLHAGTVGTGASRPRGRGNLLSGVRAAGPTLLGWLHRPAREEAVAPGILSAGAGDGTGGGAGLHLCGATVTMAVPGRHAPMRGLGIG